MKNSNTISKKLTIGIMLLSAFIYFASPALGVSAEKGNFVKLGRLVDGSLFDEKIDLKVNPGVTDVVLARVPSGTIVLVLDTRTIGAEDFYIVSTVGKDGGMMGWVSESYIYEITAEPPQE